LPSSAITDEHGHVLLLPHKTGGDGFYIARFKKTESKVGSDEV